MPRTKKIVYYVPLTKPEIPDKEFWEQDRQKIVKSYLRQASPVPFMTATVLCFLSTALCLVGLAVTVIR